MQTYISVYIYMYMYIHYISVYMIYVPNTHNRPQTTVGVQPGSECCRTTRGLDLTVCTKVPGST